MALERGPQRVLGAFSNVADELRREEEEKNPTQRGQLRRITIQIDIFLNANENESAE